MPKFDLTDVTPSNLTSILNMLKLTDTRADNQEELDFVFTETMFLTLLGFADYLPFTDNFTFLGHLAQLDHYQRHNPAEHDKLKATMKAAWIDPVNVCDIQTTWQLLLWQIFTLPITNSFNVATAWYILTHSEAVARLNPAIYGVEKPEEAVNIHRNTVFRHFLDARRKYGKNALRKLA